MGVCGGHAGVCGSMRESCGGHVGPCGSMWESCGGHAFVKEGILGGHLGFSVVVAIDDEVEIGVELVVDWVEEEVEVGLGGLVGLVVTTSQDVALHLQMQPSGILGGHLGFSVVVVIDDEVEIGVELVVDWVVLGVVGVDVVDSVVVMELGVEVFFSTK